MSQRQWGYLIAHQAIEHAARLLRVDEIAVDIARMLEGFLHGALRNLVKRYAANLQAVLLLFVLGTVEIVAAKFFGEMRGDGFAFAIRIRRQVHGVRALRQLLQLDEDLFFAGDDDVFGIEVVFDIDAKIAFRQIFHVAE